MLNDGKKLVFDVDAEQIKVKKLLKKDFLELSMKAISSANPNRNMSWFTPESMERALPTFYNKPILGCFNNGDFESHNGTWGRDSETGMSYWDTLGANGERILGLIRSEDEVKIVEEGGLSWITLTCALWTQYSFKQVKRLLKDALRAQKDGGPTKSISVEIDVLDYEDLPNGVMKINDFKLVGITILGSRNGKKIEPGIEDAELSVLDMVGTDNYERQRSELRMAYAKLGDDEAGKEEIKMEKENMLPEQEGKKESFEGKEPIDQKQDPEPEREMEGHGEPEPDHCEEDGCKDCPEGEHGPENADFDGDGKEDCGCEGHGEEHDDPEDHDDEHDDGHDDDHDDDHDEEHREPEEEHCEKCEEYRAECEELRAKCASMETEVAFLRESYEELKRAHEEAEAKIASYEMEKFIAQAKQFVMASGCDESIVEKFCKECDEGKYHDIDTLKTDIAVAAFESNRNKIGNSDISLPISNPETFAGGKAEKPSNKLTSWDRLNAYNKGE